MRRRSRRSKNRRRADDPESLFKFKLRCAQGRQCGGDRVGRKIDLRKARVKIHAFHDAGLELGSVPLPVVTARVDRFIAAGGKGPYPDME